MSVSEHQSVSIRCAGLTQAGPGARPLLHREQRDRRAPARQRRGPAPEDLRRRDLRRCRHAAAQPARRRRTPRSRSAKASSTVCQTLSVSAKRRASTQSPRASSSATSSSPTREAPQTPPSRQGSCPAPSAWPSARARPRCSKTAAAVTQPSTRCSTGCPGERAERRGSARGR